MERPREGGCKRPPVSLASRRGRMLALKMPAHSPTTAPLHVSRMPTSSSTDDGSTCGSLCHSGDELSPQLDGSESSGGSPCTPCDPSLEIREVLGHGATAAVYRAVRRCDEHELAVKHVHTAEPEQYQNLMDEYKLLKSLCHGSIVRVEAFFPAHQQRVPLHGALWWRQCGRLRRQPRCLLGARGQALVAAVVRWRGLPAWPSHCPSRHQAFQPPALARSRGLADQRLWQRTAHRPTCSGRRHAFGPRHAALLRPGVEVRTDVE
mmetsp:Transcript_94217/g.218881  ORF Transcript_94217/g.218881 Transcript_94217/m.218881 type:complete len:264 (-) Transcript_94217:463-1254(-)